MAKNPSAKGFSFERLISKQLSLWWSNGDNDAIFWRTGGSGGRATNRMKKGKKTAYEYGDISFTDPIGQPLIDYLLIECKKGYTNGIDVLDFLDKKTGIPILLEFWNKALDECDIAGRKTAIIIFERNRRHTCVMMNYSFFGVLKEVFGDFSNKIKLPSYALMILKFDEFLDKVHPDFFKKYYV